MCKLPSQFSKIASNYRLFGFVAFGLLVSLSVSGQDSYSDNKQCRVLEETIALLDARWDAGGGLSITSNALIKARMNKSSNRSPYTWSIYSFRNNELESIEPDEINEDLKSFSVLLRKAYEEYVGRSKGKKLNTLGKWIGFMEMSVSTLPLNVGKLDLSRSKVEMLSESEKVQTECLLAIADKIANSPWQTKQKLLAFKYLSCKAISLPWVWNYVNPGFTRLSRKGGATTDLLQFNRLSLSRVPFMKSDSKIWRKAPRYFQNQLNTFEASTQKKFSGMSIEFNDVETRVTYRIPMGLHESWLYFDKTSILVDFDTKKQYQVNRIVNGYPLGKTFVIVGCIGRVVEFTLIYPPVKKSMKSFTMENRSVVPVNYRDKKRYMLKHSIMSDGGNSYSNQVFKVSDYSLW